MGACASYPYYEEEPMLMQNRMLAEEAAINNQMALQREREALRQVELMGGRQRLLQREQNVVMQNEIISAETGMANANNMALQNELILGEEMGMAQGLGPGLIMPGNNMMRMEQNAMLEVGMATEQAEMNQMILQEDMAATAGMGMGPMAVF